MPEDQKNKSGSETTLAFSAGQYGANAAANQAAASNEMINGMDKFLDMVNRVQNKPEVHLRGGHLFETIIAAQENAEKAAQGLVERVHVTHLEGHHQAAADLQTRIGDRILAEGQAKFSLQDPDEIIRMISEEKYHGMDRYIPTDKIQDVRNELLNKIRESTDLEKIAQYKDALEHLKDHDISSKDIMLADKQPRLYAAMSEGTYFLKEAGVAGAQAAAAGLVMGGALAVIKNGIAVTKGELTVKEAAAEVGVEAGKSGLRSGATGVAGTAIRFGAEKAGIQALAKSNVATSVAAGVIDIGMSVYAFAKGEITAEETMERIGQTGVSTMSGIYAGAVASLFFGPAGVLVGSMAGYFIATQVYQSCISIFNRAKLAEEEATRVVALCDEACRVMKRQRLEFENLMEEKIRSRREEFATVFEVIERGMESDSAEVTVGALTDFALLLGKKIRYTTFEEFDDFMIKSDEPLVI
ncbi:MAG: hypothetical protein AB1341_14285 [Bacillota bacterium]